MRLPACFSSRTQVYFRETVQEDAQRIQEPETAGACRRPDIVSGELIQSD